MGRRDFVRTGMTAGTVASVQRLTGTTSTLGYAPPKLGSSAILDAGLIEQQELMAVGKLTSHSLTSQYLARIKTIDKCGPRLNIIIDINPSALKIALEMDRERALKRVRGPLHGIPVLIRDTVSTADRMNTAAGGPAQALAGVRAVHDAHVVALLRDAGAVIIGKINLNEWASPRPGASVSGWSGQGGLHSGERAGGAGAAIAAGLATLALDTGCAGAMAQMAALSGVVGIAASAGLLNCGGIFPAEQDEAAVQTMAMPLARKVTDAALMLAALMRGASHDGASAGTSAGVSLHQLPERRALADVRIGVPRHHLPAIPDDGAAGDASARSAFDAALQVLRARGALLVELDEEPNAQVLMELQLAALALPTGADLPAALAGYPRICMPAGRAKGQGAGLSFIGPLFGEAAIIGLARAFEQAR
ncbi:hypothetical protein HSX11_19735 [Oxalobacteraceae bacterium]|nr:hypothetical protein [Oxalobacteraceae bacterium]